MKWKKHYFLIFILGICISVGYLIFQQSNAPFVAKFLYKENSTYANKISSYEVINSKPYRWHAQSFVFNNNNQEYNFSSFTMEDPMQNYTLVSKKAIYNKTRGEFRFLNDTKFYKKNSFLLYANLIFFDIKNNVIYSPEAVEFDVKNGKLLASSFSYSLTDEKINFTHAKIQLPK